MFILEGKRRKLVLDVIGREAGCCILSQALYFGFLLSFAAQLHVRQTVQWHVLHSQYVLPRNGEFNRVMISL